MLILEFRVQCLGFRVSLFVDAEYINTTRKQGDSDGRNRRKFVGIDRFRRISDEPVRRYRFVGKKNSSEFRQKFRRLSDEYRETSF